MAPARPLALPLKPKMRARKAASSTIAPMRTPARGVLPTLQDGAWIPVKNGWLTARAEPTSAEEFESWGADVVLSLQERSAGTGIADRIVSAAAFEMLYQHLVIPIGPICNNTVISERDLRRLICVVWWSDLWLAHGRRVLLYCKHGCCRTGVAIYLLLRSIWETPTECLSLMKKMRPDMHLQIVIEAR
jgi:hypothetical protein